MRLSNRILMTDVLYWFYPHWPRVALWRHKMILVIMGSVRLFVAKSLPEPLPNYCGLDRWEHFSTEIVLESSTVTPKQTLIARFMGTTWGPSGADRTQVGPTLAPWTLLSGKCICLQNVAMLSRGGVTKTSFVNFSFTEFFGRENILVRFL